MIRKCNQDIIINLCKFVGKKIMYNFLILGYIFYSFIGLENYKLVGIVSYLCQGLFEIIKLIIVFSDLCLCFIEILLIVLVNIYMYIYNNVCI